MTPKQMTDEELLSHWAKLIIESVKVDKWQNGVQEEREEILSRMK